MKEFFNTKEISDILGNTSLKTIERIAKSQNWPSRPRSGRGGGKEYHLSCLPDHIKTALIAKLAPKEAIKESGAWVYNPKPNTTGKPPLPHHLNQAKHQKHAPTQALRSLFSDGIENYFSECGFKLKCPQKSTLKGHLEHDFKESNFKGEARSWRGIKDKWTIFHPCNKYRAEQPLKNL